MDVATVGRDCLGCSGRVGEWLRLNHCAACHLTFVGLEAFDKHRSWAGGAARGVCVDPAVVPLSGGGRGFSVDHVGAWHWGEVLPVAVWRERARERATHFSRVVLRDSEAVKEVA